MGSPNRKSPAPLVGPGGCLTLAITFVLCGLFQLFTAQVVEQPGIFGDLARVVPVIAVTAAIVGMAALSRLPIAYRALWVSAGSLLIWFVATWLASLGP
jgi:hypothetical protein